MTFIEFIGFIITISAMVFLFARQTWENYRRRKYPEAYAEEVRKKDDALKELLKSMNIEVEEEEEIEDDYEEPVRRPLPTPPPPPKPLQKKAPEPLFHEYHSEKMDLSDKGAYALVKISRPSRGKTLINHFPSKRELFVIREILGPPRCDQEWK
jgi:hypothetical protein